MAGSERIEVGASVRVDRTRNWSGGMKAYSGRNGISSVKKRTLRSALCVRGGQGLSEAPPGVFERPNRKLDIADSLHISDEGCDSYANVGSARGRSPSAGSENGGELCTP
ncbi:hypothetical protein CLCR_04443 [Cladophialophora carrionii]|uniref:Uncharacterized protein n=1 Tax=Cladophialophora carrionii TaxID=86049 RepID=A0A1C1CI76_9EURO|nr:hypothetical protein CLCR_04443 [Cladophialophora carrionii]